MLEFFLQRRLYLLGALFFMNVALAEPSDPRIKSIELNLNKIHTLQAKFTQKDPKNKILKGEFYLSRPGKLKFSYEKPSPFLLIADGDSLIYEDHTTTPPQTTYFPLTSGPASLLLQKEITLGSRFKVAKIWTEEGLLKLLLEDQEGAQGILHLDPVSLILKGWTTVDIQGNRIEISLDNIRLNEKLAEGLFAYKQKPRWQVKRQTNARL